MSLDNSKINILICGDNNVFEGMALCTLSIVKKTTRPINLYLFTLNLESPRVVGIDENRVAPLREYIKTINPLNEITVIDVKDKYNETFLNTPNESTKYTPCTLIRLLAPYYLNCERIIYLDTDIMLCDDISILYDIDISKYDVAIVKDYLGRFFIKYNYFNAGVMYINLKEIVEDNSFENSIELLKNKKFFFADQAALNKSLKKKLYLPMRFNEQRTIKNDTVIKHFLKGIKWLPYPHTYNIKQWMRDDVHNKLKINMFDDIYEIYDSIYKN